jgi:hypothetical protein
MGDVRPNYCFATTSSAVSASIVGRGVHNAHRAMRRSVWSGCQSFVAMMQTTDLRDGDYLSPFGRVDRARIRTVFSQGQMRPCSVVIVLVRREDAVQMALVEDDEVVETLAPDRPDDSLDIRILPG